MMGMVHVSPVKRVERASDILKSGRSEFGRLDDDEMITFTEKVHTKCDWCNCENGHALEEITTTHPEYEGKTYCSMFCLEAEREVASKIGD